jgi:predicted nucleic acid-binding protein
MTVIVLSLAIFIILVWFNLHILFYDIQNQVSKEQTKLSGALRRLQESQELADTQAMEIKKLKNALGVCACRSYELLFRVISCLRLVVLWY